MLFPLLVMLFLTFPHSIAPSGLSLMAFLPGRLPSMIHREDVPYMYIIYTCTLQSPSMLNFSTGSIYTLHCVIFVNISVFPTRLSFCKGRDHDLLINMLSVPSANAWHKVVNTLWQKRCGAKFAPH